MNLKKILWQALLILSLSSAIGLGANFSLLERYFRGEFRHAFLSREEYASISFITLWEAEDLFSTGKAIFIDSRTEKAFRERHIFGALNIPFEEHREERRLSLPSLPLAGTLVVYCDGSECQSSVALARFLHQKGFLDIKVFFGGWNEWLKAGFPISSENDSR